VRPAAAVPRAARALAPDAVPVLGEVAAVAPGVAEMLLVRPAANLQMLQMLLGGTTRRLQGLPAWRPEWRRWESNRSFAIGQAGGPARGDDRLLPCIILLGLRLCGATRALCRLALRNVFDLIDKVKNLPACGLSLLQAARSSSYSCPPIVTWPVPFKRGARSLSRFLLTNSTPLFWYF